MMANQHAVDLIQEEKFGQFNALVDGADGQVDLSGAHLRGFDMRKCHLAHANLSNAYLRAADIRGLDLSAANLAGASLKDAKISGVLFPLNFTPDEIMMSLQHGTRLRPTL